ncbi:MAG: hypothetical protein KR126chlam3_01366 [Chlamydiae bacterium]|nr:hypothetical protein [Chlamydiota bacterium]
MDEEKKKEGVSVKELEGYAKRHRFEIFFCILFILASLFTLIFWGPTLSVFLTGLGAIISIFIPDKIDQIARKMAHTVLTKEGTTQLIIGIIALIVAIFLAPLIFLLLGLHAGCRIIHLVKEISGGGGPGDPA